MSLARAEGNLSDPIAYTVGVHYWNDHGYGDSLATVRVWALGGLAMQVSDVKLASGDLWTVGRLHWPNTLNGGNKAPFELCKQQGQTCAGGKTQNWQSSGQWCIAPCYKDNAFSAVATKPMGACDQ